jgi:hypothetical protein
MARGLLDIHGMVLLARRPWIGLMAALVVAPVVMLCLVGAAEAITSLPVETGTCLAPVVAFVPMAPDSAEPPVVTVSRSDSWGRPLPARWLGDAAPSSVEAAEAVISLGPRAPPRAT